MIGIYKITSPKNKIYIGQSNNIKLRFSAYKRINCNKQPRLFNSLLKHGYKNHTFEILCECEILELNDRERYYQDLYNATGKNGLNCQLTKTDDLNGRHSEETKLKISLSSKGRKLSQETKNKISIAQKGKNVSEITKMKLSLATKNQSKESLIKKAISNTGKKRTAESKELMGLKKRALILNLETGVFYEGVKSASFVIGLKPNTLKCKLNGQNKNNTNFIYV